MLNVLLPMGGQSPFFEGADHPFPKPLVEFLGKPMIQHVVENLGAIKGGVRFIFVLLDEECRKFHLESTVRLLAGPEAVILKLHNSTQGAACSALLAIEHINTAQPLLIVNADQLFDIELGTVITRFKESGADAGCLYFDSVHPRWSYVRIEGEDDIIETAEKRPISRHAIAGFYFFARGCDFVEAAQHSIRKDASVNGQYFVSPVLNELILLNRVLKAYRVPNESYHTFYSPQKIEEYENLRNIRR